MNIEKCTGYFHDGALIDFKHMENKIEILMLSAEIVPEHMLENMPPLNKTRISGMLHLEGLRKIRINDQPFTGVLKKVYDSGSILDFEVLKHTVILGIEWKNWPPKPPTRDVSKIEIEAEKIVWQNIPDLSDDCCKKDQIRS